MRNWIVLLLHLKIDLKRVALAVQFSESVN